MNRRGLLQRAAVTIPFLSGIWSWLLGPRRGLGAVRSLARVRPGDPAWPSEASWNRLSRDVGGRLVKVSSPLAACTEAPSSPACAQVFKDLKNPYYLGDEIGLTQSLGWVAAWTSRPSVYAVAARTTEDVVAAVNFAREHNLRVVVKGGGHSYQGTSNAADSLLIWTRKMNAVTVHDAFIGAGCAGRYEPHQAVTVEAGAIWGQRLRCRHDEGGPLRPGRWLPDRGRRRPDPEWRLRKLLQGLWDGGGEPAGGRDRHRRRRREDRQRLHESGPVLGLKGGGGGSLGVVTRLTLRTHPLPDFFGAVNLTIEATSDAAFRRLIGRVVSFYSDSLHNPHWGEQIAFRPGNVLAIAMVFQGLDQQQAETIWRPFLDWLAGSPQDFRIVSAPWIVAAPARRFWDPGFLKEVPGVVLADDRRAPPRPMCSGRPIGRSGTGPARLPVGMASGLAPAEGPAGILSAMPCLRRPGIGACRCTSTRALRARRPTS